jgi:hypothetical protein
VRKTAEDILFAEKKAVPSKIHYLLHASKEFPGTVTIIIYSRNSIAAIHYHKKTAVP